MKNCLILLSLLTALPLLAADAPKPNPRPAYLTEADARAKGYRAAYKRACGT